MTGDELDETDDDSISTDTAFGVLANVWRRRALSLLRGAPGDSDRDNTDRADPDRTDADPTTVERLADELTDGGNDAGDGRCELRGETARSVRIDLAHVHLPKLDDAGLVAYDHDSGRVRYRGDPTVEQLLDAAASMECAGPASG
ncbi:hypothetical protein M0R88_10780 [Halorussus gelatinilyticus]|uniref:DUF7344 domain-containing protein n=1 Tax=Halorussus gelatinilyticus TaxID=2937524 RepID=A0A8U0IE90_9EURY|nr:hypothetical protein [Halorussus gelatinilyticus]UPV99010.1 hypothetical protein M0R88_10780 [Halorussus gelatinilyticus]